MRLIMTLFLTCAASWLWAQSKTVSGKVTDANGNGLMGVTISEKAANNTNSTVSIEDGSYSISVSGRNPVLVFSFVGYATREITVGTNTSLSVQLKEEEKALQEVYVVAYGNQSKRNLTSAVSTVDAKTIKSQQVTSATQALQGTAPGVLVVNNSGQPGDNPQIRIRGIASVNASAEPLIVLDGVPFNGNLNMINPSDIENFSVLKDATATALYGSRAANGVILITTKGGRKKTAPQISLSATNGWSSRALPEYDFLNQQQMMEINWEGLRNAYQDAGLPNANQQASDDLIPEYLYYNPFRDPVPVGADGKLKPGLTPAWNTDWTKELTRTAARRQDYNVGVTGGSENSSYFFGLGYLDQEGYVKTSNFNRVSTRFNFTSDVNRWLTLGVRTQYTYSDQNYPDQAGSNFENTIQYLRTMSSLYPVYQHDDAGNIVLDADGNPIYDFGNPIPGRLYNQNRQTLQPSNLVATTILNTERRQRHMSVLNGFAEIKLLPSLRFRSNFGLDRYTFNSMSYENPDFGNGANIGGRLSRQMDGTTSWTWNNMLTWKQRYGDHNIEVMGAGEWYRYQYEVISGQKTRFPFGGLYQFNNAANTEALNGYLDNLAINSFFGRAKYDFAGKYFVEGTLRWDGSSRFAPANRWGFFPAVGASWLISEEGFMQGQNTVNLLKLRASYGRIGNEALASFFPYLSTFSSSNPGIGVEFNELDQPGFILDQLGNEEIEWEKQANYNIGVDFALFNSRLNGSVDFFNKSSVDLLFRRPLVLSGGIPFVDFNIGDVTNRGIEINLTGVLVQNKNITWEAGINATFIENELKKLPQEKIISNPYQQEVGKSIYEFFMAEWAGVDPADGMGMWYADEKDASGNPTGKRITVKEYSDATRYYQGTAIPKVSGGFNTRFSWKGLDASVLINYALGGKYYDGNYAGLVGGISAGAGDQLHSDILNRWQAAGDVTNVPRLDINNTDYVQTSTRFLFSGDYARLRNVTLGYTFNPRIGNKAVQSIRVFAQADNMFTWSNLKRGADPETNVDGNARQTSSVFKIVSGGIEILF